MRSRPVLIILLCLIQYSNSEHICDNEICNNEGICVWENSKTECICLQTIYTGETCDDLVNHCLSLPCRNNGVCSPTIGGFHCACTKSFQGQNCTQPTDDSTLALFQNLRLYYDHIGSVSIVQNALIVLANVGEVDCTLELSNENYAIESFSFPQRLRFIRSENIQAVARKYGITKWNLVDRLSGYYVVAKLEMEKLGQSFLQLTVTHASSDIIYFDWTYEHVAVAPPLHCFPIIVHPKCQMPKEPMLYRVHKKYYLDPMVIRSCGPNSVVTYEWTVKDYLDKKTLHSFGKERSLKISPYTLAFNDEEDPFRLFYVLKLYVKETSRDQRQKGMASLRCYIYVDMPGPVAVIDGGQYREHNHNQTLSINAKNSRNMAVRPDANQKLSFSWRCFAIKGSASDSCSQLNATGKFNLDQ